MTIYCGDITLSIHVDKKKHKYIQIEDKGGIIFIPIEDGRSIGHMMIGMSEMNAKIEKKQRKKITQLYSPKD